MGLTSGLPRPQLSSDLGGGVSTLNKWVQKHQHDDLMSGPHEDIEKENARLRKENRFAFIDTRKKAWPIEFLCKVLRVTSRGYRGWKARPMSQRQRDDMMILAQIREQHRLSLGRYGRPRMTQELQELGLRSVRARHIGGAQSKAVVGSNGVGDDLPRKTKTFEAGHISWNIHAN